MLQHHRRRAGQGRHGPDRTGAGDMPSEVDVERVRAAVTLALDAALPAMIDKITEQVLVALGH